MNATNIEVADIVRQYGDAYLERFAHCTPWHQRRVLLDIARCRTSAMGGHVDVCPNCGHLTCAYNSCRNRHCPKCLGSARWRWTAEREAELLPVPYFHVVFTLPHQLAPLALANQRVVYGLLFRAAAETLSQVAAEPKHLGARIGFLAVLHTWGQKLNHHPHVHCVVPGGGLSPDGARWIPANGRYFLPVQVLSTVYRAKFLDLIYQAYAAGKIRCPGKLAPLSHPVAFKSHLASAKRHDWVVYTKPPFGGPRQVLRYLARYTHRVAIANSRLVSLQRGTVAFRFKDYADGNTSKIATLTALVFIRRFLMHVLPTGFTRIRYYGFLSNRDRRRNLETCRQLLGSAPPPTPTTAHASPDTDDVSPAPPPWPVRCPECGLADLQVLRVYPRPFRRPDSLSAPVAICDTS